MPPVDFGLLREQLRRPERWVMDARKASVQTHGAALYQALLEADMQEEALEFYEWFLEITDLDLED